MEAITSGEIAYLRELAKKQLEYAHLPEMAEKQRLWRLHNSLRGERAMVVIEEGTFLEEILPPLHCENPSARRMETSLLQNVTAHTLFDDDKVVPDFFPVYFDISVDFLGQKLKKTFAQGTAGYHIEPILETLEDGMEKLHPSDYRYDKTATADYAAAAEDAFGDILPIVYKNSFNWWSFGITQWITNLMGMENMLCSMVSEGDAFHQLMRLCTDDLISCLRWQEKLGLIVRNDGNDYLGSGSFCFGGGLPEQSPEQVCVSQMTWGHLNSQESVGISPAMYAEFIYPYYEELARQFGIVYYGCCEPVHTIWDGCLEKLPGLRKLSISPWCDEEIMSERLKDGNIIYSRKPSPNYFGVTRDFDEESFANYIAKTVRLTRGGCKVEFIFRDIMRLHGNTAKLQQGVEITRRLSENLYG